MPLIIACTGNDQLDRRNKLVRVALLTCFAECHSITSYKPWTQELERQQALELIQDMGRKLSFKAEYNEETQGAYVRSAFSLETFYIIALKSLLSPTTTMLKIFGPRCHSVRRHYRAVCAATRLRHHPLRVFLSFSRIRHSA